MGKYTKIKADGGPKKKAPIAVNDLNDPRLKAYADSSAAYNLTTKYDPIFKANTTDPRMKDYDRAAANITRRTGIAPATIKTDSWEDPMPRNFSPGAMEQAWMGRFKKPTQPYIYAPRQETLNIPPIQYNPKDTNPYNKYVVNRYLPTPESPVNPIPYDDIQLYSGHQNRDNQGLSVGYVMEDGKRRDIMADEYNAIMGSSVQGGTKLENTNYAMGGMIKRKDGSYSKRGLWDNIRANKGSGKEPTKEMLEQERKIKAKYPDGGPINTLEGDLISKVLMNRNKGKDFVQRAYAVGDYPNSNMFTSPDPDQFGSNMSHKMGWGTDDKGQAYMYPTVMNSKNEDMKVPNQYADYISSVGYKKATGMLYAMGGKMNQAQQLNAGKMRMGSDAPDGSVWKDIGAGAYGVLEGTLDTVTMGATDKLTDAGYKGLQKLGGSGNTRQQDMIRGFGNIGGAVVGAAVNPASGKTAISQGIKGLGQGVGNINENTQGIGNAISGLGSLTGLIPSGGGNIGSTGQQEMANMAENMKMAQGGLMHINEGGTHEQNALGGVPIGPNALVEQGETINNDFVFSDRLKPKGSKRTYAQLSKSVDTKYKLRPDDKLSKEAKQMDLDRLAMQQEAQKDEMSTKYMQKAMACGGKIKGFGGQIMGPISQSMNVTNGQNTMLAMGGNLPNYDYGDDGNIRRSPYNNMVNAVDNGINNVNYQPSNDVIFNERMQRDGFNPTLEDYNKVVLGQKQAAMGGLMSNFMEKPTVYQNPAVLSNQYKLGGNMYALGGNPLNDPNVRQGANNLVNLGYIPEMDQTIYDASDFNESSTDLQGRLNAIEDPYISNLVNARNPFEVTSPNTEANFMGQMQGNAFDKYAGSNQNPYPEVNNTGYLTNLAGNLVKAGMVATSKPPIYNPSLKFNRMNANPAERLAMQEGRREIQGTKDIIRNNATSSGQYLTNASLMGSSAANKLAGTIGGIRQNYDQQNVGIGNQEAQLNQQITAGNNLAKETFRDNRLNQYNKILDSVIGANQQRFSTDEHANNYQNQVVEFLKTKGFSFGYKDGKLQMLDANGNVANIKTD